MTETTYETPPAALALFDQLDAEYSGWYRGRTAGVWSVRLSPVLFLDLSACPAGHYHLRLWHEPTGTEPWQSPGAYTVEQVTAEVCDWVQTADQFNSAMGIPR